jgi:hypothetical protein
MKRYVPALALVVSACLLAACGVPLSSSPTRLPASDVPAGLQANVVPTLACQNKPQEKIINVYFVAYESGNLQSVGRCVPSTERLTVTVVLKLLEEGVPVNETNLTSYVLPNSNLVSVGPGPSGVGPCPRKQTTTRKTTRTTVPTRSTPSCGLATVRLDRYYYLLVGSQPIDELAQIVWSLTKQANLGVTEVLFEGPSGRPKSVQTASGTFVSGPVTRGDYRNIGI